MSWAGENREVLSLAFGLTVPVQRKLPVSVLTVLSKDRLCVTCEMSHLRRCDDEGLPLEHVSLHKRIRALRARGTHIVEIGVLGLDMVQLFGARPAYDPHTRISFCIFFFG